MRKACLFLLITFFAGWAAHCQTRDHYNDYAKWWGGARIGGGMGLFSFNTPTPTLMPYNPADAPSLAHENTYKRRPDWALTLWAEYSPVPVLKIGFMPGIKFYSYGLNTGYTLFDTSGKVLEEKQSFRKSFSVIELPITLKLTLPVGNWRPYGLVGGGLGILIAARSRQKSELMYSPSGYTYTTSETTYRFEDAYYRRTNMFFMLGGGLSRDFQSIRMGIEVLYTMYPKDWLSHRTGLDYGWPAQPETYKALRLSSLDVLFTITMPLDNLVHLKEGRRTHK